MRKSQLYSISFGLSLIVLLAFSWLLNDSINSLTEKSFWVEHSEGIIDHVNKLNIAMMDIEASQRGFLLTHDSSQFAMLIASRNKIPLLLDTLATLTLDNEDQHRNVTLLRDATVRRLQKVQDVLNRSPYLTVDQLTAELRGGNRLMEDFRMNINKLNLFEQYLLKLRLQSKRSSEQITPTYFKLIFSITTVIALISFILLQQEAKGRLDTQAQLEMQVNTLARTNTELEQIAHVTSHDLQEPLRKIRTFSDLLVTKFGDTMPEEAKTMLERIDKNANAIRQVVADLSDFANLANKNEEKVHNIDLNKILLDVQKELNTTITSKKAQFSVSTLPVVSGYEKQVRILLKEIIMNALKFSKENVTPEITITGNLLMSDQVRKEMNFGNRSFNVVSIYDNGIGFDNHYASKIFVLFQSLHGTESPYHGKGIGLAVCQRIMTNHNGFITATAEKDQGATIQLYFPII